MPGDPSNWDARWKAALRQQHRDLFDYETKRIRAKYAEYTQCPVCDTDSAAPLFEKDWFQYVKCRSCSMVYMNPRLNQAATYAFYNSSVNAIYNETKFDQVSSSTLLDDQINLDNLNLINGYRNGDFGKLLEIGSAKGFFLSKAKEQGYDVFGIELNEKNCEFSRRMVGDTVYNVELFDVGFEAGMFDVIYMRDVIEHIHNPKVLLLELNRISKPGALLFIETHNIDGLIYRIVKERHTVIFAFEHPTHWSPQTLGNALGLSGFQVKEVIHSAPDFTVQVLLGYFLKPSFTTIIPPQMGNGRRLFLKMLLVPWRFRQVRWLDHKITPRIATWLRRGSVMKVIARKQPDFATT